MNNEQTLPSSIEQVEENIRKPTSTSRMVVISIVATLICVFCFAAIFSVRAKWNESAMQGVRYEYDGAYDGGYTAYIVERHTPGQQTLSVSLGHSEADPSSFRQIDGLDYNNDGRFDIITFTYGTSTCTHALIRDDMNARYYPGAEGLSGKNCTAQDRDAAGDLSPKALAELKLAIDSIKNSKHQILVRKETKL